MRLLVLSICLLIASASVIGATDNNRADIALDEDVWVLFYDLPSRRFRNVRDAFVRRNWSLARRDLEASAGFLRAELARADATLITPLTEVIARLETVAEKIESPSVSGSDLDAVFARAHWLLAQHYLLLSEAATDSGDSRRTGTYLWATAHHLERCVLWSDARMTRRQLTSLESLRHIADRLRETDDPDSVYRSRPIAKARKTIHEIGVFLDRRVSLPAE